MIGTLREGFPRVLLELPGVMGYTEVEFIVDTGFEGELALPQRSIDSLDVTPTLHRELIRLADGSVSMALSYEILLEWHGEARPTSVLQIEGQPLIGVELLSGSLLQAEMTEHGEVLIEPL